MNGSIVSSGSACTLYGKISALPGIDRTLTRAGMCADAKATGDEIAALKRRIVDIDPHFAHNMYYSNTTSGLTATQVQAAIDELAAKLDELRAAMSEEASV